MVFLHCNKCCFCINLRFGCTMIVLIGLVANISKFILGLTSLLGLVTGNSHKVEIITIFVSSLTVFIGSLGVLMNILLLCGIIKNSRPLVTIAWIYMFAEFMMFAALTLINPNNYKSSVITFAALWILFSIYLALVVRSYSRVMD